jgi:signal transduction histidine kinase
MIQDDGKGFDRHRNQAHGIGLLGMQERVQELGGKFSLASEPKKGTRLEFDIPVVRTEA